MRLPVSGVSVTVAEVPSLTVNKLLFPRTAVPSYVTVPLPVALIVNEYVVGGITSNSTSKVVLAVILLITYWLFDTFAVTSVLFSFTDLMR